MGIQLMNQRVAEFRKKQQEALNSAPQNVKDEWTLATEPNCTKKAEEALLRKREFDNKPENVIGNTLIQIKQNELKQTQELMNKPIKAEAPKFG